MDVACLFVADFLVALARRDTPSLRGQPVVIGGSPEEHAQVTACSEEAAASGVFVGTTLRKALALCPKAVFLPLQESRVTGESARIIELLQVYSPVIEAVAPGHAHFEVRGLARLAGLSEEEWLADLQQAVRDTTGLLVRLAAAQTVFAAHAGAAMAGRVVPARNAVPLPPIAIPNARTTLKQGGVATPGKAPAAESAVPPILIPAGVTRQFLATLPVEALPISAVMLQQLRLFGLLTVGQVGELTFSAMQAQFGREGARAWELATGKDDSKIVPAREELRLTEETDLPAPTALAEPLVVGTRALIQRLLGRKELKGQSVRRMDWRLGLESGEQLTRRLTFREPTDDGARMLFLIRGRIERLQLPAPATSIAITLSGFCSEYGHQANLWPIGPRRWRELCESIEQLTARVGEPQVYRIVEVQPWSRIPERQLALVAFQQ
jgi:nucleotidyltransferase/DNA polymerase involved in DNA repair